ncbi:MAG TPA: hypothetical protein VMC85_09815 [Desulfomonilaceae bacterium]|nr:hypothetical protein [Desulfomonilaceae bacterium]
MKKCLFLIFSLSFLLAACSPSRYPELTVSLSGASLMQGVQAIIHVHVSNPDQEDRPGMKLLLGISKNEDSAMSLIQEIPISLNAGQTFEQDVPWYVDLKPVDSSSYLFRSVLEGPDSLILAQTSTPLEFVQPALTMSIAPKRFTIFSPTTITFQVTNPSDFKWNGFKLLLCYAPIGASSQIQIIEESLNLAAGEVYTHTVNWNADFQNIPSINYQLSLMLLLPDDTVLRQISTPIDVVQPDLNISIDPAQLMLNTKATIHVSVTNPSEMDWQDYQVHLYYEAVDDTSRNWIQTLTFSLKAGETFQQDVTWNINYIPPGPNHNLDVLLMTPGPDIYVVLAEVKIPLSFSAH